MVQQQKIEIDTKDLKKLFDSLERKLSELTRTVEHMNSAMFQTNNNIVEVGRMLKGIQEETDTNARGYGYEVAMNDGQLLNTYELSEDNPFKDSAWRSRITT